MIDWEPEEINLQLDKLMNMISDIRRESLSGSSKVYTLLNDAEIIVDMLRPEDEGHSDENSRCFVFYTPSPVSGPNQVLGLKYIETNEFTAIPMKNGVYANKVIRRLVENDRARHVVPIADGFKQWTKH